MELIGKTVISHKQLGVVLGWNMEDEKRRYLDVFVFDVEVGKYMMTQMRPKNLIPVENPLILDLINGFDAQARESYLRESIDQALATHDQEWFTELMDELNEIENGAIRVGSVVSDRRGRHVGIVISDPDPENNHVQIVCWNNGFREYMVFTKRLDLIELVRDPEVLERMNVKPNHHDIKMLHMLRSAASDLALATDDRQWFDELNQKETSDGS